ncbi:uncharacterized protein LOC109861066 isoform X2 [Pseudomyrmex gracilis]|uniref:uncharacterized protein LOC109861066 isoform X2 n=1 Tax=Pseudomyrmex gracilis TaxID=219809 RepID=UPI0009954211|nr:uncharacterized protein LOC109861066 isoform X2 [Pseudomyrmex gracilis]
MMISRTASPQMTHHTLLFSRRLSLALMLIATCVATAESSVGERRHVDIEESSQREGKEYASGNRDASSSTSNNKITAEPGRKVSHRLIGGHVRFDSRRRDDGESLWDDGILMSAAGNGKEGGKSTRGGGGSNDDDDEKKTLSQQVKEGKYGLIQNEIYGKQPKRPGIISYLGNPEVPKDTIDNLGGLDEEEIWLAENHVLVLRGGKFPEHEDGQQKDGSDNEQPKWPPIDDYKAPRRQVKIPARPKIPPPFPVQLTEGGPIQIIGPNGTREEIGNSTLDYSTDPLYTKGLLPGESPYFSIAPNGTIFAPDLTGPSQNFSVEEKSSKSNNEQIGIKSEPQPPGSFPPFYHAIPPGAVFVPPPSNQSDYDEEDQSIYYPPPYSFHYPQDNTTAVPPGPLVPGIILPPPPDFFSLDDKKTTTKKYTKRPTTTPSPSTRSRPTYLPPRKFTTKHHKSSTVLPSLVTKTGPPSSSVSVTVTKVSLGRTTKNATKNTFAPKQRINVVKVTTETSRKPQTLENTNDDTISPVIGNQVSEATTQQKDWSTPVTSKAIPVLAYYPSTTQSSLERPVEVTPASIKSIITTSHPGRSPNHASYYFYEESTDENAGVTSKPPIYYETTTKSPYYNIDTSRPQQVEHKKHYYAVETIEPVETPKDYKTKVIDNIVKNSQTFHYTDDSEFTSSKFGANSTPRDQSQRMLADQAPIYYQPSHPNHPPQTYYTTPKSQTYYRQTTKPKPIYQYSFQVADYSKRGGQRSSYHREQQQDASYSEYQNVNSGIRQYEYEDIDTPRKRVPYKTQYPVYPANPTIVETTANPHHAYFTQQDEKLLDDVTKEYFTIFGKKLTDTGISSTTPIYGKSSSVTEKPTHDVNTYVPNAYKTGRPATTYKTPNVKVQYGDQSHKPYSLKDDTLVNYQQPLPPINPDSEFIEVIEPKPRSHRPSPLPSYENYRLQSQEVHQHQRPTPRYRIQNTVQPANEQRTNNFVPLAESREELEEIQEPVSLLDDIDVNYRNPRPPINPDAEFIDPVPAQDINHSDNPNAYFAYRLPGDVSHFYFLTPQAITQRQDQNDGYVYPKPRVPRLLRRRRHRQGSV